MNYLDGIEDFKNREVLKVANKCIDEMLGYASAKLEDTNQLMISLKQTKQDIENLLHMAEVTTEMVFNVVSSVVKYKEELQFLGMCLSGIANFMNCFEILLMFIN